MGLSCDKRIEDVELSSVLTRPRYFIEVCDQFQSDGYLFTRDCRADGVIIKFNS